MTLYDDYRNTDYLPDVSFIAGTEVTLKFPVKDTDGVPLSISGASMIWVLGIYGQPDYQILQKTATAYDANTFAVELSESDTLALGDVIYLQQMRVTDSSGKKMRPAQGVVVIRKAIPVI